MRTEVKPTIFVGLGGTGAVVIQKLKYLLIKHFSDKDTKRIPDCFRFLEVDIDTSSAQTNDNKSCPFNLDSEEYLTADIPHNYIKLDKEINSSNEDRYKAISQWWPKKLGEKLNLAFPGETAGQAYQIRHLGRAALWLKYKEFYKRFRTAKEFISDERTINNVNSEFPSILANSHNGIDVYVFSSIAGGTGCGMVIDALAVMKHILGSHQSHIKTFFALPSCFYKWHKSDDDRNPAQVNAYAALKEFDKLKLDDPGFTYTEKIDTKTEINYHTTLSNFTYLISNENMSGANYGGDILRISDRIANYCMHMIMGLAQEEDKGQGIGIYISGRDRLSRAKTSNEVTRSYSSFGMHEYAYPHEDLKEYAGLYSSKIMLASIINDNDNYIEKIKEILEDSNEATADNLEKKQWINNFCRIKKPFNVRLNRELYNVYLNYKRRKILPKILKDYRDERQTIERYYNSDIVNITNSWLIKKQKEMFTDSNYGIQAVKTFLEELTGRLDAYINILQNKKSTIEKSLLTQQAFKDLETEYKCISKLLKTNANREKQIRNLLNRLNEDLEQRKTIYESEYLVKILSAIKNEIIDPGFLQITKLDQALKSAFFMQRDYCKNKESYFKALIISGRYFGCNENNIQMIKDKCKTFIQNNLHYIDNINNKIADSFEWDPSYINGVVKEITDKIYEDHDVLFRLKENVDDVKEELDILSGKASPMWRCPQDDLKFQKKYMLHNVDDISKYVTGTLSLNDIRVKHLTKYQLVFINNNHGMVAGKVQEVIECYKKYKNQKGIPVRANNIIDIDSHILRDSKTWPDLVFDTKMNVEMEDVIRFSQDLEILVKDEDSYYYTLYLRDNKSERYNGLVNVQKDLSEKIDLYDEVLTLIVHKTSTRFLNDPEEFLKWEAKVHFPEELSIGVKKKLGL